MNLLVTNTRTAQAYEIIRCLRPYAKKIVVEMYGRSKLAARISSAANSRLVDKRYHVPYPTHDWQAGRIQRENTEREEAYLQTIFRICEQEQIDTIFPSHDAHVYVFSKNHARLKERGILTPVADYDTLLYALDKYRTIQAAEACGFPHPRTVLAENDGDTERFAGEVKPPWVIRPRFTAGSIGMEIVADRKVLVEHTRTVRERFGIPMLQEYIPGMGRQNFYVVADNRGVVKFALSPRVLRQTQRMYRNGCAACETDGNHALLPKVFQLMKQMGWRGSVTVQTKTDPRNGQPTLMEANPRLGTHLWYRTVLGFNEPLMCLKIARGEEIESFPTPPPGVLLLEPIEDTIGCGFELLDLLAYRIRTGLLGKVPLDATSPPPSLREITRGLARTYLNKQKKCFSPHFQCLGTDPLVSLLWSYTTFRSWTLALKHLGQ